MVRYYDLILLMPLFFIVILKIYGFISFRMSVVYWVSFLASSIMYALEGRGIIAGVTLIVSLVFMNMSLTVFTGLKNKLIYKSDINCVALFSDGNKAVFFDGIKRIEKVVDETQEIIPGKIYIISKNN